MFGFLVYEKSNFISVSIFLFLLIKKKKSNFINSNEDTSISTVTFNFEKS